MEAIYADAIRRGGAIKAQILVDHLDHLADYGRQDHHECGVIPITRSITGGVITGTVGGTGPTSGSDQGDQGTDGRHGSRAWTWSTGMGMERGHRRKVPEMQNFFKSAFIECLHWHFP
ncbi:MAG: hypothetical protein WCO57_05250 [Verrucomicrobiota bacterium]